MVKQDFNGEFLPDWADNRAREWLDKRAVSLAEYSHGLSHHQWIEVTDEEEASLAAMLREVQDAVKRASHEVTLKATLAEVRRIIGEVREKYARLSGHRDQRVLLADDLLARLDALGGPRISTEEEAKAVMGDSQALIRMREIQ